MRLTLNIAEVFLEESALWHIRSNVLAFSAEMFTAINCDDELVHLLT